MLNRSAVVERIKERIQMLRPMEIYALFLLSVQENTEKENAAEDGWEKQPWQENMEANWVAGVLARYFRRTDITGYLGAGHYVIFLTGDIAGSAVYEKASGLVQALQFAARDVRGEEAEIRLGIYVDSEEERDYESLSKKAEYALQMAGKDQNSGFYICTALDMEEKLKKIPSEALSPENVLHISSLERLKSQLHEKTAWLSFVADQTDYQLWEVDIRTREFRMLFVYDLQGGRYHTYPDFPESLIESGRVHSDSAEAFRSFAEELLSGRMQGNGNFMVQYRQSGCYGWASLSYQMICDDSGKPLKAIGMKEDLSYIPWQQTRFVHRRIMPQDLYQELYCFLQVNLTGDSVEKLMLKGRQRTDLMKYQTYDQLVEQGIARLFLEEDGKRLRRKYNRQSLLEEFERGGRWEWDKCRVVDSDGSIRWISMGMNLDSDPETGDICLYGYFSRADRRMEWEKELKEATQALAQTDPDTGLYRDIAMAKMLRLVLEQNSGHSCTLVQISIEGVREIFPDGFADRRAKDIAAALQVFLGAGCLTGWKDEERILALFPDGDNSSQIRSRLENAFSFVRVSLSGMHEMKVLRFVAAAVCGSGEESMEEFMSLAEELCALHAGEASDTVEFCYAQKADDRGGMFPGEELENLSAAKTDAWKELPSAASAVFQEELTKEEKDMALACMELMLNAVSARDSLNGMLRRIGEYYQADRVYILMLTEDNQIMTMLNEWVAPGKYSILHSFSGRRTESFPAIANYAGNPRKMVLARQGTKGELWKYVMFPMDSRKNSLQVFCMENPREDMERTALLDKLLPYLGRERKRQWEAQTRNSPLDYFFALPNLDDCMNMLYSLDSDDCSSLGIMMVDVPEYESLKEQRGFEYGRQLLLGISEVLFEVFGNAPIFHTREEEFVVLCTDVAYHSFLNLCARAKQMMGRSRKGLFRMGATWSDKVYNARDLVSKARSIMECDTSRERIESRFQTVQKQDRTVQQNVLDKLQTQGEMTIYLQPKIDMKNGCLMGTEALVRFVDQEGKLLPHGRVIEEMNGKEPYSSWIILCLTGCWRP